MDTPIPASPNQSNLEVRHADDSSVTIIKTLNQMRRERLLRTEDKLREEDLIEVICENVCSGGSVVELCEVWDVQYHRIVTWVYDVKYPARKEAYEAALGHRVEWMRSRILGELKSIGLVDIAQAYDDNGKLKDPAQMPIELRRAISGIDTVEEFEGRGESRESIGYTKKVKFWDKLRALELLGENLAMFKKLVDVNHSGKITLEDLVAGSNAPLPPSASLAAAPATSPLKKIKALETTLEENDADKI